MKNLRNKKGEKWLQVAGFENYLISNYGRVYSKKSAKLIKQYHYTRKYFSVTLFKNGTRKNITVHRLVAQMFISNDENKPIVHHIDHNSTNNKASNLEWVTAEEHKDLHKERNKPKKNRRKRQ